MNLKAMVKSPLEIINRNKQSELRIVDNTIFTTIGSERMYLTEGAVRANGDLDLFVAARIGDNGFLYHLLSSESEVAVIGKYQTGLIENMHPLSMNGDLNYSALMLVGTVGSSSSGVNIIDLKTKNQISVLSSIDYLQRLRTLSDAPSLSTEIDMNFSSIGLNVYDSASLELKLTGRIDLTSMLSDAGVNVSNTFAERYKLVNMAYHT